MMHEPKRKIGHTAVPYIGEAVSEQKIREIRDLKEIIKFIRQKTYNLDPTKKYN